MDYSKLSDIQINAAVAICIWDTDMTAKSGEFDPCNNPADTWPIIIENKIALIWYETEKKWSASGFYRMEDGCWEWDYSPDEYFSDENPLRAAMIVFLMMQDGDQ